MATPNQLIKHISEFLPNESRVLELGCGSSNFAEKLMSLKHKSVVCLDFSKEVIKSKQKKAKEGVSYKVHDITSVFPFEDGEFEVILDKGTLDCLYCADDFVPSVLKCMK